MAIFRDDRQYQQLHRALVLFCRSNGSIQPEDDASETISRLCQKSAEGVDIENLEAYAMGIARNVIRENQRRLKQDANWRPIMLDASIPEALLRCLEKCKRQHLSARERKMIQAYYEGDSGRQIANRAKLAKKLGMTPAARLERRLQRPTLGSTSGSGPWKLATTGITLPANSRERQLRKEIRKLKRVLDEVGS